MYKQQGVPDYCRNKDCGEPIKWFQVNKEGPNKGKWFYKCDDCEKFVMKSRVPSPNANPRDSPNNVGSTSVEAMAANPRGVDTPVYYTPQQYTPGQAHTISGAVEQLSQVAEKLNQRVDVLQSSFQELSDYLRGGGSSSAPVAAVITHRAVDDDPPV
jgi:hypothetical protein